VTHATDGRFTVFFERSDARRAGGVQPGGGAEDALVFIPRIFDHIDQERYVAAMTTHQVEAVEAARHERIDHRQPEILEGASAGVHCPGKGVAVGADAVGHNRQGEGSIRC